MKGLPAPDMCLIEILRERQTALLTWGIVHGVLSVNSSGQSMPQPKMKGGDTVVKLHIQMKMIVITDFLVVRFEAYEMGWEMARYRSMAMAHRWKIDDVTKKNEMNVHIFNNGGDILENLLRGISKQMEFLRAVVDQSCGHD